MGWSPVRRWFDPIILLIVLVAVGFLIGAGLGQAFRSAPVDPDPGHRDRGGPPVSRRVVCDNCGRAEATAGDIFDSPASDSWLRVDGATLDNAGDFCSLSCLGTWASAKAIFHDPGALS